MRKFKSLTLIGVLACLSAGGCVSRHQVVEAAVTDYKTGQPAADVSVSGIVRGTRVSKGTTDENGRVKVFLPDRGGQIHVLNLSDRAQLFPPKVPYRNGWQRLKGFLWVRGNVFSVDEATVREGGCLPYDSAANSDRPAPFYTVSLTPVFPQTPLERFLDRLGFVWWQ